MKPLSPKVWAERIDRSQKAQKPVREEANAYLQGYQGNYSSSGKKRNRDKGRDEMNVNAIYALVELISPSIYSGYPKIIAHPKRLEFEPSAKSIQEVTNYWLNELGAGEEYSRCLFDSFFGYAAIEIGWHYETKIFETDQGEQIVDDGSEQIEMESVQEERTIKDQPFMKWRNPFDVLLDADVPRRKDGRFQIIRDIVTYPYFLEMPNIDLKVKQMIRPSHRPEDDSKKDQEDTTNSDLQSDSEWVELYWVWCRESEKRYLWTPQLKEKYLSQDDWPYYIEYKDDPFPVTILDGKIDCRSPYTFSEIRPLWDHIIERNRLRSAFGVHMKRSIPKYLYNKQAGTRAQISKFFNSRSDEATELNNPSGLIIAPVAPMPAELYQWDAIIADDFQNVSSLSEYKNSSIADTATEASIMEGRSSIRKNKRKREFEQFIVSSSAKLGMLCQQFMDVQQAIKIEGQEGSQWVNLSKEDIQGEYNFDIEPGIMEPKNEALHKQQVLKYSEIMAANPHTNQRTLATEITKAFGLSNDKMLLPEEQVQQNQQAAADAEVKKEAEKNKTKVKDIGIEQIPSGDAQTKIVLKVMEDMGIQDQPSAPGQPALEGQAGQEYPEMDGLGNMPIEPVGGNMGLEPVSGQQIIQPASESPPSF